jgi:hypothetical protein
VPGDVTNSEDEAWKGVDEPMIKPGGKGEYLYPQLVPTIGR